MRNNCLVYSKTSRIMSFDGIEKADEVFKTVLNYFGLKDVEVIKKEEKRIEFNASTLDDSYRGKYKIVVK